MGKVIPFRKKRRKRRRGYFWRELAADWRFRALSLLLSVTIAVSAYMGLFSSLARGAGMGEILHRITDILLLRGGAPPPRAHKSSKGHRRSANFVRGHAQIVDGDSLRVNGVEVRLHGIDAPELFQTCRNMLGKRYNCGKVARLHLAKLIGRHKVHCRKVTTDRYGRMVAICKVNGWDIGKQMVRDGWAIAYVRYSRLYVSAERAARRDRRGLWAGRFIEPSTWRRMKRRY